MIGVTTVFIILMNFERIFCTDGEDFLSQMWKTVIPTASQNAIKVKVKQKLENSEKISVKFEQNDAQKTPTEKPNKFKLKGNTIKREEEEERMEEQFKYDQKLFKTIKNEPILYQENKIVGKSAEKSQKMKKEPKIELEEINNELVDEQQKKKKDHSKNKQNNSKASNEKKLKTIKTIKWRKELGQTEKEEYDEEEQIKIIDTFDKLMKQLKEKNIFNWNQRRKIEREIAKKLGTYREKILKWKKTLLPKNQEKDEHTKLRIIDKFEKMKKEAKMKVGYKNKERDKIESEIVKKLGIKRHEIYKWKNELFEPAKKFSLEQKSEIIELFEQAKVQFTKEFDVKLTKEIEEKIALKFKVCRETISNWKRHFGIFQKNRKYSKAEKLELIQKFDEEKSKNPWISDKEMEQMLPVKKATIQDWKRQMKRMEVTNSTVL